MAHTFFKDQALRSAYLAQKLQIFREAVREVSPVDPGVPGFGPFDREAQARTQQLISLLGELLKPRSRKSSSLDANEDLVRVLLSQITGEGRAWKEFESTAHQVLSGDRAALTRLYSSPEWRDWTLLQNGI